MMRLEVYLSIRLTILLMIENLNIPVKSCGEKTSNVNYDNALKGYFTNNITDYEIVVPKKVSRSRIFQTNYLPHFHESDLPKKRVKREILTGSNASKERRDKECYNYGSQKNESEGDIYFGNDQYKNLTKREYFSANDPPKNFRERKIIVIDDTQKNKSETEIHFNDDPSKSSSKLRFINDEPSKKFSIRETCSEDDTSKSISGRKIYFIKDPQKTISEKELFLASDPSNKISKREDIFDENLQKNMTETENFFNNVLTNLKKRDYIFYDPPKNTTETELLLNIDPLKIKNKREYIFDDPPKNELCLSKSITKTKNTFDIDPLKVLTNRENISKDDSPKNITERETFLYNDPPKNVSKRENTYDIDSPKNIKKRGNIFDDTQKNITERQAFLFNDPPKNISEQENIFDDTPKPISKRENNYDVDPPKNITVRQPFLCNDPPKNISKQENIFDADQPKNVPKRDYVFDDPQKNLTERQALLFNDPPKNTSEQGNTYHADPPKTIIKRENNNDVDPSKEITKKDNNFDDDPPKNTSERETFLCNDPPKNISVQESTFNANPPKNISQRENTYDVDPPKSKIKRENIFNDSPKNIPESEAFLCNDTPRNISKQENIFDAEPPKNITKRNNIFDDPQKNITERQAFLFNNPPNNISKQENIFDADPPNNIIKIDNIFEGLLKGITERQVSRLNDPPKNISERENTYVIDPLKNITKRENIFDNDPPKNITERDTSLCNDPPRNISEQENTFDFDPSKNISKRENTYDLDPPKTLTKKDNNFDGLQKNITVRQAFLFNDPPKNISEQENTFDADPPKNISKKENNYDVNPPKNISKQESTLDADPPKNISKRENLVDIDPPKNTSGKHIFSDNIPLEKEVKRDMFPEDEPVHYDIPINGKKVKVRLTPNRDPFPSSMIIEHHSPESMTNVGKVRLRKPERHNCHFKGKIVNDPDSKVALSTCNGLAGSIQSKEGDFFIEPIKGSHPNGEDHPHIVYRKRDEETRFKDSNCLTKGKNKKVKMEKEKAIEKDNSVEDSLPLKLDKKISNSPSEDGEKSSNNEDNDDDGFVNKEENEEDDEEPIDNFTSVSEDEEPTSRNKLKKNNVSKGRSHTENLNNVVEDKKTKSADINKKTKKGHKQKTIKEYEKDKNTWSYIIEKNEEKKRKKTKVMPNSPKFKNNISNNYKNKKNQPEISNKNIINKYKVKDTKEFINNPQETGEYEGINEILHKTNRKHCCPGNVNNDNSNNNGTLSEWENIIKSMKMKAEKDKNDQKDKNNLNNKENIYKELSLLNHEILKYNEKENAEQNARTLFKHEARKMSKNKKGFAKRVITDETLRKQTHYRRNEDNDNSIKGNDNEYSDRHSSSEDIKENIKEVSNNRIVKSPGYFMDSYNTMETMEDKIKRSIQYKSCKPEPTCTNKSEHTWDLRLLIVVSYQFSQRHKDTDLETFILTVVNMVSSNFHDASLGILLNVKLVRMIFIEYKMEELDEDKNSLEQLFENFCVFQYRVNPHRMDHPNHHDIAIYVASFQECGGTSNKMYGVTNVGSVCHTKNACIVSKDEGLLLGNIITHQIGHSLGADHDDGGQGSCQPNEPDGSVYYHMNPVITLNSTQWSKCSGDAIQRFVRNTGASCLESISKELEFDWPTQILPGQVYSPVQQCALNLHIKTLPCYTGNFCKFLYCQATATECVSLMVPPADGTLCASGMWCVRGECVTKGRHPGMVNGEWSGWGPWTQCSRSCGGGVQHSFRLCNNPPPALGGRYCVGRRLRHQICNADTSCDRFSTSFREHQCKLTDGTPFRGKFYTWKAFFNHFEYVECALLCESHTGIVAVRQQVAADGTPCKPGTKNVCIQGKCEDVGCDWKINSGAVRDACGVCHGNGTECRVVQGIFDDRNGTGFVPFLKVPKGSGMIYARELNPSAINLVVASYNTDTFYINGPAETSETRPAEYDFGSTKGIYSVKGKMERIFIPGPTEEDLIFYVRFSGNEKNPGVRYQFGIPEVDKNYIPSYSWQFLDWEPCSDACGGGQQRAMPKCVEDQAGIVESKYCLERQKPPDILRSCNEFPCLPKWWVGAWSDCVTVASEKVRYRSVLCMRTRDPNSLRNEILKDKYCCEEEKPDSIRRCNETVQELENHQENELADKFEFPSVYNLRDLEGIFSDLTELEERLTGNSEAMDNDKDFELINDGIENPKLYNNDIPIDEKRFEEAKVKRNLRSASTLLVNDDKKSAVMKGHTIQVLNKSNEAEYNNEGKTRHGKNQTYYQPNSNEGTNSTPHITQTNPTFIQSNSLPQNMTEMNLKIIHPDAGIENIDPFSKAIQKFVGTGLKVNPPVPKVIASKPKDKEDPEFQNKFGGNSCSLCTSAPVLGTKKFPPLRLPAETTCTTKCTTCPILLEFTLPNSDFLTVRPPCPEIDEMVISDFTISIIPIICGLKSLNPTDMYFEVFHESGSWPHGLESNKTIVKGQRALFYLTEIRENITRQPFVFHSEN